LQGKGKVKNREKAGIVRKAGKEVERNEQIPNINFGDISARFCSAALGKDVFKLLLFPDNYKDIALLKSYRGIGYNFDRFKVFQVVSPDF
jgi:hypothetical protein